MTFQFRDAVRADTRLLIGLAGGTGSGKTESAMRLATGLANGDKFAVIDTESGRALHKADDYKFKHGDLTAPFTPERYWEAIAAADEAGYPVIVIDSFSHVWEGVGGVLEMQEQELERLGGGPSMAPKSWIKPKGRHRRLINQMLQVRAHLIVCMRAQDKIEIAKEDGKTVVRPAQSLIGADGWVPICERRFPHELTMSLLLLQDAPGIPKPIKLERRHAEFVPLDRRLDEQTGAALSEWAAGGGARPSSGPDAHSRSAGLSVDQFKKLIKDAGITAAQGAEVLQRLFPEVASSADLTDEGRGRVWEELARVAA